MADPVYGHTPFPGMGFRLFEGRFLLQRFQRVLQGGISRKDLLTATAGGTKAAALPLVSTWNRCSVVATDHDSVLLPPAIAGSQVIVINGGAAILDVYGKGTDTIDGVATATANTIAAAKLKEYTCLTKGLWITTSILA